MNRHIPNTLFAYPDIFIEICETKFGEKFSESFIDCANTQLTPFFEKAVGFKVNKLVEIGWVSPPDQEYFLRKGPISEFSVQLIINHYNFPVTMRWKSKSGKIYDISQTDIDCSDIDFSLEGLDPLRYNQQMFPKVGLPFQLKDLTYELYVERMNIDCTILLNLKQSATPKPDLVRLTDDFIGRFNASSEKKDRKDGVVHNWKSSLEPNSIIYQIDLGSAGLGFLKKLLMFFSKMNQFVKVRIS